MIGLYYNLILYCYAIIYYFYKYLIGWVVWFIIILRLNLFLRGDKIKWFFGCSKNKLIIIIVPNRVNIKIVLVFHEVFNMKFNEIMLMSILISLDYVTFVGLYFKNDKL